MAKIVCCSTQEQMSTIKKRLKTHCCSRCFDGLVSLPVNTIPYHVVPAQAGIHAQHVQNATSRIDPRLRGDDNNSTYLQDEALEFLAWVNLGQGL